MVNTNPGVSLFEKLSGITEVDMDKNLVETFTDADWQGGGSAKSTSSGSHFVNGLLVHTSSRTQHVISLSSTESEFYATTSGAIDTIYLKHITEFLTGKSTVAHVLTDNSASRQISCKLGTSRLRHINGRLLWIQSKVRDNVLRMVQVGTLWNPADIGTKNLSRDRHLMLLYMLGMVDDGNNVGEDVYLSQKQQEFHKKSIRRIKNMFLNTNDCDNAFPRGNAQQGMYAKQILRIAVCQTALALGQAMDVNEPNTQPLEPVVSFSATSMLVLVFATVFMVCFAFCFMMPEPEPEDSDDSDEESEGEHARFTRYMFSSLSEVSDPEEWQNMHHHNMDSDESSGEQGDQAPFVPDNSDDQDSQQPLVLEPRVPLRPNMVKCYAMLSASFRRLKQVMMADPRQQGRGFAVLFQLQQVYS